MSRTRFLAVIGTRPEAIKMAPVIQELRAHSEAAETIVCSTGQHREMLRQTLEVFGLKPDLELDVMRPNQTLSGLTARLIEGIDEAVLAHKPDWILAQGDTTTVMAASIVAFYHKLRFAHIEAGLRSHDRWRPFPEEMNRHVADLFSDALFAPTAQAREELLKEGYASEIIHVTGNTVIDALHKVAAQPYDWSAGPLAALPEDAPFVLITAHRRESFGGPFRDLCLTIRDLAAAHPEMQFVYPVHLNPNVRAPVMELLSGLENVHLLDPLDYRSLVNLMKRSRLVLTDSGGIQEEAPSFGVPVLVLRETTERPEGLAGGLVKLVGTSRERITTEADHFLAHPVSISSDLCASVYGDGQAARRIVEVLLKQSPTPSAA